MAMNTKWIYGFIGILRLAVGLCCAPESQAQNPAIERGNRLYKSLAFHEAIPVYESALSRRDDLEASMHLADCYRLTSNSYGAERWYGKVVSSGMSEPIHHLYYAQALLRNGKIELARVQFEAYVLRAPDDVRGRRGLAACEAWDDVASGGIPCRVSPLNINTPRSEFAPVLIGETLLFCSDRDSGMAVERAHLWTGRDFLNVYRTVQVEGGGFREPDLLPGKVNGPFHDGPVVLDSALRQMYFTRNTYQRRGFGKNARKASDGIVKLSLFRASREGDSDTWTTDDWQFAFNNDEFSTGHPALSPDGKILLFASDRPGGLGGVDLYRCVLQSDGTWSLPENLGPQINSAGDELFPVLHPSGDLLYASDGWAGLGGLDLYLAEKDSTGWAEPRNLGAPLNSFQDDFSLFMTANWQKGYFSSNRTGGRGLDDLYALQLEEPKIRIRVRNAETLAWMPDVPLEWLEGDRRMAQPRTDSTGQVLLDLPRGKQFNLKVELPDFKPLLSPAPKSDLLSPAVIDWIVELEPVGAYRLIAEVIDGDSLEPLPDAVVILENTRSGERIPLRPEKDGIYRANLEPETDYRLTADLPGFIGDQHFLSTAEMDPPREFYEVLELYKLEDDLVIELSNIYYDLDRWYIRRDAAADLDRLAELMRRYPAMRIELASHTDARATDEYNQVLSQRRAEAAVAYLVTQGVERDRMVPVGYGESKPRNRCVDGVSCSEKEHQYNRRTEFKVINFGRSIESRDKEFIPVNTYQPSDPEYLRNYLEQEMRDMVLPPKQDQGPGNPSSSGNITGNQTGNMGTTRVPPSSGGNLALPGGASQDVWFQSGRAWGVHLGTGTLASASRFDRYRDLGQIQFEAWTGGRYLFVLGYFTNKSEAEEALKSVLRRGLNEAYLVIYKDGERQN